MVEPYTATVGTTPVAWLGADRLSVPEGVLHAVSLAFALIVVTMLHMVFGEQAPKIWAIHTADRMSLSIAYPIYIFVLVLKPLIALINASSNLLLRVIGIKAGAGEETTHDVAEIRSIIARSAKEGYLTLRQGEFAENILGLVDLEGPDTIGGYVVSLLKRLPKPGDSIAIGPYDVTVVSVSRHRANKLRFVKRGDAVNGDEDEVS